MVADSGTEKAKAAPRKPSTNPNTLDMIVEAITTLNDRKGASVPAIKSYILDKYSTVDPNMLKYRLKKALVKGLEQDLILRPKSSDQAGASLSGRFRINKTKIAALEKAKQPKPKAKPKAEKPKAKKPKEDKAKKTPKKETKKAASEDAKKIKTAKKSKDVVKAKKTKATTKSPGKTKDKTKTKDKAVKTTKVTKKVEKASKTPQKKSASKK